MQASIALPAHERALQAILSPAMDERMSAIEALDADGWTALEARVADHRLEPLIGWLLRRDPSMLSHVPSPFASRLKDGMREQAIHALAGQHLLVTTVRMIETAGLEVMALKGACIAFTAYPEPGLRQMRDVDLLLPSGDDALEAFGVLISNGYGRYENGRGDPAASLDVSHQLPPLVSPDGMHLVELHHRVTHHGKADGWSETIWERARTLRLLDHDLVVPSPEDQLVHLVRHAAADHCFDNGPLTVSDLHFLSQAMTLDLDILSTIAAHAGLERETAMLCLLAERAWTDPDAAGDLVTTRGIDIAWSLMLADPAAVRTSRIHAGLRDAPASLFRRIVPTRQALSREHGKIDGAALHASALARHWSSLGTSRGAAFLKRASGPRADREFMAFRDWRLARSTSEEE